MSAGGTMRARLVPAIAALVVGLSGGYVLGAVANGSSPPPPPVNRGVASPAPIAEPGAMDHAAMGHAPPRRETPSAEAYRKAAERMHADMTMTLTGDADLDFAKGMIPHHRGAVDMARVELEYGRDAEMRRLASDVVRTQEKEISQMRTWIERRGPR